MLLLFILFVLLLKNCLICDVIGIFVNLSSNYSPPKLKRMNKKSIFWNPINIKYPFLSKSTTKL